MYARTQIKTIAVLAAGILWLASPVAWADDTIAGQDAFRDHCKSCHMEESANGEYTPMTLISDQWIRFFERKYERKHKGVLDPAHGNRPVTEVIDPELLELIKNFAIEHAADSEHPMTCG